MNPSPHKKIKRDELKTITPLSTKLYVPPFRSAWISRARLEKKMEAGLERKLTLLSAPAGFGKTTVLVDWIHKHKIPTAWFSLDKGDNDPLQFLTYVILGLQTMMEGIGKAPSTMLQSPQPPPIETILINLINDANRIQKDFVLVMDDYHLVDAQPVHDMITFLLENLPEQMHLIIATRSDPHLPLLARLRSQDQMIELRAADLCFKADETANLFNKTLSINLSARDIHQLETRTEGWIAGLQLAGLSLQGHKDPSGFIAKFKGDNQYIADYLTEEVLNRQPEHLRDFLLHTSILERLSGPLCDALTCQENSQQTLNTLEKANLFVIPLDEERSWYRYHHLFADLLKQQMRLQQGELESELHRRASQWLAENGFKNEAVDHAFASQNNARAAQLIEEIAEIYWDDARESRLLWWLKKLPDELIDANPKLCIFYARELIKSEFPDEAETRLQTAEQLLASTSISDTKKEALQGRIAAIRAYESSRTGDAPRMIHFSKQALKLLPQSDLIWRSVAASNLGVAYTLLGAGDLVKAQRAFSEAKKICEAAGNIYYTIFAGSCLGSCMLHRGRLNEAENICRQSLSLANENRIFQTGTVGNLYSTLGAIMCERNEFDEGIRLINKGIELCQQGRDPGSLAVCRMCLWRALIYRADFVGLLKVMQDLNEQASAFRLPYWMTNSISAFNAIIWLATGDLKAAVKWAQERGLSINDKLGNLHELEYFALVHILFAKNRLDDADQLLQRMIEDAKAGDRVIMMIDMHLLRVRIFKRKKDPAAALGELKLALALAQTGGSTSVFVSKGKPMAKLLEKIIEVNKHHHDDTKAGFSLSFAKKLLAMIKAGVPPKIEGLIEPLSERELEVLYLIAAGLQNKEIAEKLFISLNTVKTHLKNINSKLDVKSRIRAVARAKEMGLL
jgi:LuxR family maltose regulon positive regulatory protein